MGAQCLLYYQHGQFKEDSYTMYVRDKTFVETLGEVQMAGYQVGDICTGDRIILKRNMKKR
jgi:hypothetical protein